MKPLKIGNFLISTIVTDNFRLDGGAMFGSVPRQIWQKQIVPDEKNRIPLVCRLLLIESDNRTFLVDIGLGSKWQEKEKDIFAIENLLSTNLSIKFPKVTDIILTHLHFDHAGGLSYFDENSELKLTFPNARYYLQRTNFELAQNPGVRERASYLKDNLLPLKNANLHLLDGNSEIIPGLQVEVSNGHTKGLQWVLLGEGGEATVAYPSDLIPTSCHVPLPFVMGYDMCAETTIEEKRQLLDRAEKNNWIVIFEHDPHISAARIKKSEKGGYTHELIRS